MKVLLIGSGGREHALAWKLAASAKLEKLYCAPGNPGIAEYAELVALDVTDHAAVIAFAKEKAIDLVVVGPEAPLVAGLADDLAAADIRVFGPSKLAAQLEGSKGFTKDLCARFDIPTGAYGRFNNAPKAKAYVREMGAPIVVKADGLAAGKGVVVAMTLDEALDAVDACFEGAFGSAGAEVVVEEFLDGEEASFFCICDGKTALPLGSAQDHKRVGDGDTGVNTGGMGAYAPAPVMTPEIVERTMRELIEPTMRGMAEIGAPFSGVLFLGLMIGKDGPKLIEYNTRFGDPECQVLMMRLETDLLDLINAAVDGKLDEVSLEWKDQPALTVVMAAEGYPTNVKKGSVIRGLDKLEGIEGLKVFHAGTAEKDGKLIASGGRVLNVTAIAETVAEAQANAYDAVKKIDWPEGFYRSDIGWRAVERERSGK
ncbi:phosphoribosylamine--glycine ligase [Ochrobactrum sp. MYb15]|uniref:phosphoribosylamine--glycine ligase n=1 Tax=Brucella TaxID=234 RepID=UPI000467C5A8|nr:phosphoribosylamine--glycine ligase [Brucella rhizosphaerae]PQZ49416.1 phosphoribosylamine--glycine ligase [Ochrobactrum sp. MYb19]PRA57362.1 phosphoribosylamine--glycine ligase [Ochrobactrum sp. MYb68]PRA66766.1 phosphoribosylamine--glycine ligase [Ochrobactrum sp. MYb18]PRA76204.1 phosphoribosylamine--glycine ligase [Brucella thiophenivorans]PRA91776.1 phosphoribosylamine--glycine ligase [Ochrobactrum sp. MYb14]PRA98211.1 phosphoribosylamine--glycine ligase [Ochrobactrum sp. MYb15]